MDVHSLTIKDSFYLFEHIQKVSFLVVYYHSISCLCPCGVLSFVTFLFLMFSKTTILPGSTFIPVSGDGLLLSHCLVS